MKRASLLLLLLLAGAASGQGYPPSNGAVSGTTGTFSGGITASTGTFSAGITATTGAYSSGVSATTGTFSAGLTTSTGAFSDTITSSVASASVGLQLQDGAIINMGGGATITGSGGTINLSGVYAPTATFDSLSIDTVSVGGAGGTTGVLSQGANTLNLSGSKSNGSTAIAVVARSTTSYSTAGAKLLSVQNNTTEKANVDKDGSLWQASATLPTCAAAREGTLSRDVLAGVATGKATKLCYCSSNGSSTYTWRNVMTGTNGTSTVCGTE